MPKHKMASPVAPPCVLRQMVKRWEDYTSPKSLRVVIGTYNVNGGRHFRSVVFKDLSLSDWLLDAAKIAKSSRKNLYTIKIFVFEKSIHSRLAL